jgi:TFIIF-interacting CTD phosphatase-like protein
MKYFYIYIFFLLFFIVVVSFIKTLFSQEEGFNSNKQNFILLGDSIFKNNAYVANGKSVDELLTERTNGKTLCLAMDNAKIVDIYEQIRKIPGGLNNNGSTIFLSAGGNDIVTQYVDKENDNSDTSILGSMFASYKSVIKNIRISLPNANIVLVDIYYPENMTYKQYHSILLEWNKKLYTYAEEPKNNITSVLKISKILTREDEFTFGIEPSALGGGKIVDAIMSNY